MVTKKLIRVSDSASTGRKSLFFLTLTLPLTLLYMNMDEGTLLYNFNYGQADRPISISLLNTSRYLHI